MDVKCLAQCMSFVMPKDHLEYTFVQADLLAYWSKGKVHITKSSWGFSVRGNRIHDSIWILLADFD